MAIAAFAIAGGLSACGGSGGDAASPEIASLGSEPVDSSPDGSTAEELPSDPEEAQLAFTRCMREHGIDMPDPSPDGGRVMFEFEARSDADADAFETAQQECAKYMEAMLGSIEHDPAQQEEMRENMLEFAECMREHGIDMPDPVFGDGGGPQIQIGGPDDGTARRIDLADENVQAATEECGGPGGGVIARAGDDGAVMQEDG